MNLKKKINVSNNLKTLAEIFKKENATLYVVGGYVRDALLNQTPYDIDICSCLNTQQVKELLRGTKFSYKTKNSEFGTATISIDNELYEYTCFRKETYNQTGSHTPLQVEFVRNIKEDAQRRDFYVNALYYDILKDEVEDPLNKGLDNLKNRVLEVIEHPVCAFCEDATRILRLIKFSAILDFEIHEQTLELAKKYSILIENITDARLKKELGFIANLSNEKKEKVNEIFLKILPDFEQIKDNIL